MSTTWCFLGLLAGREIACSIRNNTGKKISEALKISGKDFILLSIGFIISLGIGMAANEHAREWLNQMF